MCNTNCKVCDKLVYSSSVTVTGGNVVIALPDLINCPKCLVITQAIPDTATVGSLVFVTVGADTTLIPLVDCTGLQVTASMISTRCRYPFRRVSNGTATAFKVLRNLSCRC